MRVFDILLPKIADNKIKGSPYPFYFLCLISPLSFLRSLIHLFHSDGGAYSIAGINLTNGQENEVIFTFALWGSSQLILAIIQLLVLARYRSLIPLIYLLLIIEIALRIFIGHIKPIYFSHMPPGMIANWILFPLVSFMFILSMRSPMKLKRMQDEQENNRYE